MTHPMDQQSQSQDTQQLADQQSQAMDKKQLTLEELEQVVGGVGVLPLADTKAGLYEQPDGTKYYDYEKTGDCG